MNRSYLTISNSKEVVLIVKRSKFIGNLKYVRNKEQAKDFICEIKEKFKDATHNVVAYNIFVGGLMYCSDDGEPHGTAGRPALEVLKKSNVFDVCVVITRYFGGVLLGTGGLSFSYSSCCKKALDEAEIVSCFLCEIWDVFFDYKYLSRLENILRIHNVKKEKETFLDKVCLKLVIEKIDCENLKSAMFKATNGEIKIVFIKQSWERI